MSRIFRSTPQGFVPVQQGARNQLDPLSQGAFQRLTRGAFNPQPNAGFGGFSPYGSAPQIPPGLLKRRPMPPQGAGAGGGVGKAAGDAGGFPLGSYGGTGAPNYGPGIIQNAMGMNNAIRGNMLGSYLGLGQNLNTALSGMGSTLQGNADRISQQRMLGNTIDYNAWLARGTWDQQRDERESRERMQGNMMDVFSDMAGGGGGGAISPVQKPAMSDANQIQQQSMNSLYDTALAQLAPGAFYQGGIGGFNFGSPGGGASATVPGTPWQEGGPAGGGSMGIDTSPNKIWGPELAAGAQARIGALVNRTAPYLKGVSAAGKQGLAGQFADLMRGGTARTLGQLERGGTQAEAGHQLASQTANARSMQGLWDLLRRMYQTNLQGYGGDANRTVQMLQALA